MNAASFSSLSADHQRLQALVGAWRGEEEVVATQWTDAGTAVSDVLAEAQFGGLFVVQRYRQRRDGTISFGSHSVFGFDQQNSLVTMGAWSFIDPYLEWVLAHIDAKHQRVRYTGRPAAASPATGLMSKHLAQLAALLEDALGE